MERFLYEQYLCFMASIQKQWNTGIPQKTPSVKVDKLPT